MCLCLLRWWSQESATMEGFTCTSDCDRLWDPKEVFPTDQWRPHQEKSLIALFPHKTVWRGSREFSGERVPSCSSDAQSLKMAVKGTFLKRDASSTEKGTRNKPGRNQSILHCPSHSAGPTILSDWPQLESCACPCPWLNLPSHYWVKIATVRETHLTDHHSALFPDNFQSETDCFNRGVVGRKI